MAATPESKVKANVRKLLDELKIYHFMPPANGFGRAGIPDIIGCMDGHFVAIECKAGKGTTTALQGRELNAILNSGGTVFIAREHNLDELKLLLEDLRNVRS
jgi:Holliday junction resolvase